jgi:phage shock protein A
MDDKEFLSLDLEGAREYLLAYMTSAKRYEQDIAAAQTEIGLWRGRITLAEKAGKPELAEAAKKRAEELEAKKAGLEGERQGLLAETRRLRERLPYLKARERSIDPDRLLSSIS